MGTAAQLALEALPQMARVAQQRDRLESGVLARIDDAHVNGRTDLRLPNTTNIGFARLEAEAILLLLSEQNICASAGAACSSGSLEPSHVLRAMNIDPKIAHGAIRFSLSRYTSDEEIDRALEAFSHGGLVGQGPGGGTVKLNLPDAHADFVFAVAGEEFGMVVCTLIVGLFAFIVLRSLLRMLGETNLFVLLATTGLVTSFGLQAVVNMASTLHLLPTKGMTLPFISYGGSSIVAIALGVGMLLALTRKRFPGSQDI